MNMFSQRRTSLSLNRLWSGFGSLMGGGEGIAVDKTVDITAINVDYVIVG